MLDLTQNYFELFGLPVSFDVDTAGLTEHYRELQRVVHPDRYASGTEQERRLSMQGATFLNEALDTLRDPLKRAHYLLRLKGVDPDQSQNQPMDPAFLMEQMELREELSELRGQSDPLAATGVFIARVRRLPYRFRKRTSSWPFPGLQCTRIWSRYRQMYFWVTGPMGTNRSLLPFPRTFRKPSSKKRSLSRRSRSSDTRRPQP